MNLFISGPFLDDLWLVQVFRNKKAAARKKCGWNTFKSDAFRELLEIFKEIPFYITYKQNKLKTFEYIKLRR